jgi:hypothetical protein
MSTLRVDNLELNQAGNATVSIANSYNVVISTDGQERIKVDSSGVKINQNLTVSGTWNQNNIVANTLSVTNNVTFDGVVSFDDYIKYAGSNVAINENLFTNPAFIVKQRIYATTGATDGTDDGEYADVWKDAENTGGGVALKRQVIANTVNGTYYAANCDVIATDASFTSTEYLVAFRSFIEGPDMYYKLGWGTNNPSQATLSFWFRSNQATKFSVVVRYKAVTTSTSYAYYGTTFDVQQPNTWEFKKIVIPGPTNLSTANAHSGVCFVHIGGIGGTSRVVNVDESEQWIYKSNTVYAHTNANNYLSNTQSHVQLALPQLEKGNVANPIFSYRTYSEELRRCERYNEYFIGVADSTPGVANTPIIPTMGMAVNASTMRFPIRLRAQKPYSPSILFDSENLHDGNTGVRLQYAGTNFKDCNAAPAITSTSGRDIIALDFYINTGLTAGQVGFVVANNDINGSFQRPWYVISANPTV